jgi:hypothetical protein
MQIAPSQNIETKHRESRKPLEIESAREDQPMESSGGTGLLIDSTRAGRSTRRWNRQRGYGR